MALRRIIYSSHSIERFSKRDLLDLLHESRAFNSIDGISGVLMHRDGTFVQIIEGEREVIDGLLERILRDPRHRDVKVLLDTPVESRLFADWSMGCADFDDDNLSRIPGIRTDLSDPEVLEDIMSRLPEIAAVLVKNLD